MYKIAVLEGDYSGPEMMEAGLAVLKAATQGTDFQYQTTTYPFGGKGLTKWGIPCHK